MMKTFKTLTAAAGLALIGTVAQAATVAEVTVAGQYAVLTDGVSTELSVAGNFTAFADLAFDTSATNDFLFEADLAVTGIPGLPGGLFTVDEELTVPGITGDDILGFAFTIVLGIESAFPGALAAIADEVTDGDLLSTTIPGDPLAALGFSGFDQFGFDFQITDLGGSSAAGMYIAKLSNGSIGSITDQLASGTFNGTATISTVSAVPLPATLPLLAFGGAGLMALGRRRKAIT